MTKHQMKLQPSPFEKIKNGSKTIEIRLNDAKRQLVKVGDIIEFSMINSPEQKIKTRVTDIFHFPTFKELFYAFPPEQYGSESVDEYVDMYKYYSEGNEKKYGVIGIKLS